MTITGVLETSLYVADLERAQQFYQQIFGFEQLLCDERMCALRVDAQVLLLFQQGATAGGSEAPGGFIPPHDGAGQLHLAFAVADEEVETWRQTLMSHEIEIVSEVHPPQGGCSLYFRDPDGHLVELATPRIWQVKS
jgi:catechol 2,3-dioxygenase-like lactoylglutathione lyase family enzyme